MKPRSTYTITTRPGFICLVDQGGGRSVTNDVEAVIDDLARAGYDFDVNRVIYCDKHGVWDEIIVRKNIFVDFKIINATDLDTAIAKARQSTPWSRVFSH